MSSNVYKTSKCARLTKLKEKVCSFCGCWQRLHAFHAPLLAVNSQGSAGADFSPITSYLRFLVTHPWFAVEASLHNTLQLLPFSVRSWGCSWTYPFDMPRSCRRMPMSAPLSSWHESKSWVMFSSRNCCFCAAGYVCTSLSLRRSTGISRCSPSEPGVLLPRDKTCRSGASISRPLLSLHHLLPTVPCRFPLLEHEGFVPL